MPKRSHSRRKSVLSALERLDTDSWSFLQRHVDCEFGEYVSEICKSNRQASPMQMQHRKKISIAAQQNPNLPIGEISNLNSGPIHCGAHCNTILSPADFYYHAVCKEFSEDGRSPTFYQCSSISWQGRNYSGPGWLKYNGEYHKLFDVPRAVADRLFAGSNDRSIEWRARTVADLVGDQRLLISTNVDVPWRTIQKINIAIEQEFWGCDSPSLFFSCGLVARIIALHLSDPNSMCGRILTDQGLRSLVLSKLRSLNHTQMIPASQDLFWKIDREKLKMPVVTGTNLDSYVPLNPKELATELLSGRLVPGLFLTFLVLSILPGIRVTGGHRQLIYLAIFRNVLLSAMTSARIAADEVMENDGTTSSAWLFGIPTTSKHPVDLIRCDDSAEALENELKYLSAKKLGLMIDESPLLATDVRWLKALENFVFL